MNVPSLSGFLTMTEASFRLFDLGIQLRKMPDSTLERLDEGQPYPCPHLGYAWLVIFMWNEHESQQNSLWFLKLPLDEQGILPAAVHSDLVNRLYRALQVQDSKERQRLLTDHPYQFKPEPEKMAALHARATKILGLPPSPYFDDVHRFYLSPNAGLHWQELGIQGIADFVCRLKDNDIQQLNPSLLTLDQAPLLALLRQFEHRELPTSTVEMLVSIAQKNPDNAELTSACLRACAQSPARKLIEPVIAARIDNEKVDLELLLTVLTRFPHLCQDATYATQILDRLARAADADGFQRVMTNLAMQPGMAGIVMTTLANPALTENLANALSLLIQRTRGQNHARH